MKRRALILFRNSEDLAAMIDGDLAAQCEADARSAIGLAVVEALEDRKDLLGVFLAETDAVVTENNFDVIDPGSQ